MGSVAKPSPLAGSGFIAAAIGALDKINALARVVAGLLLGIATVAVAYQITIRFIIDRIGFNISAPWTEEVARYALMWAIFIGVGVISRSASLIAVEMLPQALPKPFGKYVKIFSIVATMIFFGILIWVGWSFTIESAIETSPVMRIPMSWVYAGLPVGATLTVVNLMVLLIEGLFLGRDLIESDPELAAD